jgi:hypothetical protein
MALDLIVVDRDTPHLLLVSVLDYLPEQHIARFVVESIDQLDLSHGAVAYRGIGSAP